MARRRRVYEGKAKDFYEGPEPGFLVQHFKDVAYATRPQKSGVIDGKGVWLITSTNVKAVGRKSKPVR